jgi:hypothetical protein
MGSISTRIAWVENTFFKDEVAVEQQSQFKIFIYLLYTPRPSTSWLCALLTSLSKYLRMARGKSTAVLIGFGNFVTSCVAKRQT